MLYVYPLGTMDFFDGMVKLEDYIELYLMNPANYLSPKEIKKFLFKCLYVLGEVSHELLWEGDVKEIYISAIPMAQYLSANMPETQKLLCVKQNNSGLCFLISERYLDFPTRYQRFSIDTQKIEKTIELADKILLKIAKIGKSNVVKIKEKKKENESTKTNIDIVTCNGCKFFQPDNEGDGSGIGKCDLGIGWTKTPNGIMPLYRYVERNCNRYANKPVKLNKINLADFEKIG